MGVDSANMHFLHMPTAPVGFLAAAFLLAPLTGQSAAGNFSFADPKGVNAVNFRVDAPLNSITGFVGNLRGDVAFDPEKPEDIAGSIEAPLTGLVLPNAQMREVLMTRDWMNFEEHPVVKLDIKGAKGLKLLEPGVWEGTLTAELNCRGATKPMEIPARIRHLKGQARARGGARTGDLMFIKADFVLKRSDFGIKTSGGFDKVGDQIQLTGELVGYAP